MKKKENKKSVRNNIKNSQNGITLVALVVTIIVLIILAAVSINLVLGDNGIITKARDARENFMKAADEEGTRINELYAEINDRTNGAGSQGGSEGQGNGNTGIDITTLWPQDESTKPYLPDDTKFHISEKADEQTLEKGLVIVDNTGNEYVWIEVPRTLAVYGSQTVLDYNLDTLTGTDLDNAFTAIENALHTYTNTYRNGTSFTDEYNSDMGTIGNITNANDYNTLKQKMLKSVFQNGGFYIARYEAGYTTYRKGSDAWNSDLTVYTPYNTASVTPLSQKNKYPINYVTLSEAQTLANKFTTANYTSSLMFGVQWDLVLKYIETKSNSITANNLNSDSTNFGNYYNASYTIEDTNVKYIDYNDVWNNGANEEFTDIIPSNSLDHATDNRNTLLTTGADTKQGSTASFKMQNIYDIAGNVGEWTLEYTSSTYSPCSCRGGDYNYDGSSYPASIRYYNDTTSSDYYIGFRSSLY